MASEHLVFEFMVLYNVFCVFRGASQKHRILYAQYRIWISLAENASIGADTDPKYCIDASLPLTFEH